MIDTSDMRAMSSPKKKLGPRVHLSAVPCQRRMSAYDDPNAREDRLFRRLLNDTYSDMDELRLRYDAQAKLVEALEARVDALQKLDTVAQALVIARDVMIAQQRQIDRQ